MSDIKDHLKRGENMGMLQAEDRLKQRLVYEKSISRFSETILKDSPDAINIGLAAILDTSKSSRIYIFKNFIDSEDDLCTQQTHEVCALSVQSELDNPELQEMPFVKSGFGRWINVLSQNTVINALVDDLPESEREILSMQDIKSILVIPIFVNKEWYGFIGFDDVIEKHIWLNEDIGLLKTISEIIGLYLANKQNQEIIAKHIEELKELNATKDKFFSIIAHDLKSPFSTLLSISKILVDKSDVLDLENLKKLAKLIHSTSENTFNLLDNLLRWANSQTGAIKFKPVCSNMKDVVEENIKGAQDLADKKQITIRNKIGDVLIEIDRQMIDTILRNFLSNAVKFTNQGGLIELGYKELDNKIYEFYVKDNGVGIPKEMLANLFRIDKAISTEGTEGESGTGLGLILSKELIEKHKGTIRVESALDKGSTFFFSLPQKVNLV